MYTRPIGCWRYIRDEHLREPGIAQALYSMLAQWGIVRPDGTMAAEAAPQQPGIVVPGCRLRQPVEKSGPRAAANRPPASAQEIGHLDAGNGIAEYRCPLPNSTTGTWPAPRPGRSRTRFGRAEPDGRLHDRRRRRDRRRGLTSDSAVRTPKSKHCEFAGACAAGGTLYVTLEPCCHHGKTPPAPRPFCSRLRRVVAAVADPFPDVGGQGIAALDSGRS